MADYHPGSIANEFVELNGGALPQMKLHKLSYIAHGWCLVIEDEALIRESPEAWDNGPVYRSIWDRIRDFGLNSDGKVLKSDGKPFRASLDDGEKRIIRHVWNKYKKYSPTELSEMTHQPGTPWFKVYFERGRNNEIPNSLIELHYRRLALAGRGGR